VVPATPKIVISPVTTPQSVMPATPKIIISPTPITQSGKLNIKLISTFGVDYRPLQKLLVNGKWQEADLETSKKILEVAGRTKAGWLRVDDINNFPVEDLHTIDRLWVKISNEYFGFSVQKRIYESVGGTKKYDQKIWEVFGDRLGWCVDQKWLKVDGIKFASDAPVGHLPWHLWWKCLNNDGASSLLAHKDL
jgi:serine/threonine-protein kinase